MRTCRQDGVILKPSVPAIPIDAQFVQGGTPDGSSIYVEIVKTLLPLTEFGHLVHLF